MKILKVIDDTRLVILIAIKRNLNAFGFFFFNHTIDTNRPQNKLYNVEIYPMSEGRGQIKSLVYYPLNTRYSY